MSKVKYQDINSKTIDRWIEEGWEWGIPVSHEIIEKAKNGEWGVYLTPTKVVPKEWFGDLKGKKLLGLASGGGQQIPIFSVLGADCTVLDYSSKQCESEKMVAKREGYEVNILQLDMTNPLPFDDETFDRAQEILKGRHDSFKMTHERQSNKYLFSTLIKCKDCGWSFRRTVRQYKNTYVRWVCSGHNGRGADSCPNAITVDEEELIQVLQEYFQDVLSKKKKVIDHVIKEFQRVYKAKDENVEYEKELNAELNKLRKSREKYMDMYTDDLISREELNEKIGGMRKEIERLENELKMVSYHLTKGEQLEAILNSTFKQMEDITDVHEMTNTQLKRLINKIEVDKDGNVDIYLRLIGDLGLDGTVLIEGIESEEVDEDATPTKTVPNNYNRT